MSDTAVRPAPHAAAPGRLGELAGFLRIHRERIRPADVGLPAGGRRRTPGLRREEVAVLSGVGTTWYTWLEQGRDVHASVEVLSALARALLLDPDETTHLLRLGGHVPPARDSTAASTVPASMPPILAALEPNPASVLNSRGDMVAYNRPHRFLISDIDAIPPDERNCIWLDFTDDRWISAFAAAEDEREAIVARTRAIYAGSMDDPLWAPFLERIFARSPEFKRMWNSGRVLHQVDWEKVIHNPFVGTLRLQVTTFDLRDRPWLRMLTYLPRDEETRGRLAELSRLIATGELG